MGSSTGDLLVDDDAGIARILVAGQPPRRLPQRRRIPLAVAQARAARPAMPRAIRSGAMPKPRDCAPSVCCAWRADTASASMCCMSRPPTKCRCSPPTRILATVEVTPHHLTLVAPDAYARLGTKAQMNPPVRERHHRDAIWQALLSGIVDVLGSDHAPHTLEEKAKPYPDSPSGMTGRPDARADHARPCEQGPPHARAFRRSDQPRPGAHLRHRPQGPHR